MTADAVDEVPRHARADVGAADDEGDRTARVGQEHRRLAGGVPATDHYDGPGRAEPGLQVGGGVVDACVLEVLETVGRQAAVARAARCDNGAAHDVGSV